MIATYEHRAEQISTSYPKKRTLEYPPLIHRQVEVILLLAGSASATVDGVTKELEGGSAIVVFPYLSHSYRFVDAEYVMVMFEPSVCENYGKTLEAFKPKSPFLKTEGTEIESLTKAAYLAAKANTEIHTNIAIGYINALLGEILLHSEMQEISKQNLELFNRFLLYCSENFKSDITIEKVSRELGITPKYCSHLVSEILHENFRQYINSMRLIEAAQMLRRTGNSITYIAMEVGYNNQSTFNRLFCDFYHMTPTEYRVSRQTK